MATSGHETRVNAPFGSSSADAEGQAPAWQMLHDPEGRVTGFAPLNLAAVAVNEARHRGETLAPDSVEEAIGNADTLTVQPIEDPGQGAASHETEDEPEYSLVDAIRALADYADANDTQAALRRELTGEQRIPVTVAEVEEAMRQARDLYGNGRGYGWKRITNIRETLLRIDFFEECEALGLDLYDLLYDNASRTVLIDRYGEFRWTHMEEGIHHRLMQLNGGHSEPAQTGEPLPANVVEELPSNHFWLRDDDGKTYISGIPRADLVLALQHYVYHLRERQGALPEWSWLISAEEAELLTEEHVIVLAGGLRLEFEPAATYMDMSDGKPGVDRLYGLGTLRRAIAEAVAMQNNPNVGGFTIANDVESDTDLEVTANYEQVAQAFAARLADLVGSRLPNPRVQQQIFNLLFKVKPDDNDSALYRRMRKLKVLSGTTARGWITEMRRGGLAELVEDQKPFTIGALVRGELDGYRDLSHLGKDELWVA